MKIEQTTIQKTFEVKHKNKTHYIDYVNSDGQTLALLNRNNWEIYTDDHELLDIYLFKADSKTRRDEVDKNLILANKLIEFCIKHFNDYKPLNPEEEIEKTKIF
ncbi:hypothetical protein J4443_03745 [Candidatus Woesearchaeota archaeon]|nr:hypothetical protein [Candidatus Woesearchaeota archaeon]